MAANGEVISRRDGRLVVPDRPMIPFIEGDGTGPDIWRASVRVFDAAVERAYGGRRSIVWREVLAGEKAFKQSGNWLPAETLSAFREYLVGIKGPLTTPVGGGIRSLNVALRQELDLYVCLRPVRYFKGLETPVKRPDQVDMVIFRENTEDIYAGIEFQEGTDDAASFKRVFADAFPKLYKKIRFPDSSGIGIKPISREGSERLGAILTAMGAATRVEEAIAHSDRQRFDLASLVRATVEAYRTAFPQRRFACDAPEGHLDMDGAPELIVHREKTCHLLRLISHLSDQHPGGEQFHPGRQE